MAGGGAMPRPQHPAESHICLRGGTARLRGTPCGRGKTTPTTSPVPSHRPHFTRFLLLLFLFQRRKTILQRGGWRGRTIPQPAQRGGCLGPLLGHARRWPWSLLSLCSSCEGVHPLPSAG